MTIKLLPCYAYILKCSDGSYYTGVTWNLRLRIMRHNGLILGGGKYTRSRRPVFLVYFEKYDTRSQALKREYEIKHTLNHAQKEELIKSASKEDILNAI